MKWRKATVPCLICAALLLQNGYRPAEENALPAGQELDSGGSGPVSAGFTKAAVSSAETRSPEESGQKDGESRRTASSRSESEQSEEKSQKEKNVSAGTEASQEWRLSDAAGGSRFGSLRGLYHSSGFCPEDTVEYVDSAREEIRVTRQVKSVVDENDPDTYQIVERQQEVPSKYVNRAGDIKYAFEDGVWYEYKYSSGNITLGKKDEALALKLLDLSGAYDGYEVVHVDCVETEKKNHVLQYQYRVRYQCRRAMEKAPTETEDLLPEDLGIVAATMTVTTREKVPVTRYVTVATGEYRYYGWQELDGKLCYFNSDAEKVTGPQVIQGILHLFDEQGVKISRSGVEVSEKNGEIDWEKVAEAKIDRALICCARRESEGGALVPDAQAEKNITGARRAGIETGLSLFSQAVTVEEAEEEAEYLIRLAEKYKVGGPIAVTVFCTDPERSGRADRLDREARTKCIEACCRTLAEAGYTPALHGERAFLSDSLDLERFEDCQLWLTEYSLDLTYIGFCGIWQYTDRGTVDGISGYTGLNISREKESPSVQRLEESRERGMNRTEEQL